ncbi:PR domain zinc finger protein 10-like, partial [Mustelus asterias]
PQIAPLCLAPVEQSELLHCMLVEERNCIPSATKIYWTVFTDQSQVAYIQQDATTQQVTVLLPANQNVTGTNLAVLGSVTEAQQPMTENNSQALLPISNNGIPQITGASDSVQQMPETMDTAEQDLDSEEDEDDDEEEDDVDSSDIDDWEPGPPRPFNPCDLWCEDCNKAHPSACLKHGTLHCIPNRPVLSRARASLPLILYINRFAGGIFSKRRIPKRTQFGPVEGPLVKQSELTDDYIHLKVAMGVGMEDCKDGEKPGDLWFDLSDENLCNWMMFVRQAQNHLEQNLVVYQYGKNLYFTTIKHIEPKQELKFTGTERSFCNCHLVSHVVCCLLDAQVKHILEQVKNILQGVGSEPKVDASLDTNEIGRVHSDFQELGQKIKK